MFKKLAPWMLAMEIIKKFLEHHHFKLYDFGGEVTSLPIPDTQGEGGYLKTSVFAVVDDLDCLILPIEIDYHDMNALTPDEIRARCVKVVELFPAKAQPFSKQASFVPRHYWLKFWELPDAENSKA